MGFFYRRHCWRPTILHVGNLAQLVKILQHRARANLQNLAVLQNFKQVAKDFRQDFPTCKIVRQQ